MRIILLLCFCLPLTLAAQQHSQHLFQLETDSSGQLLYWNQQGQCPPLQQPLRQQVLQKLQENSLPIYGHPEDSQALDKATVLESLRIRHVGAFYDPQTLAPVDSSFSRPVQLQDIRGFYGQLYWSWDSSALRLRSRLLAYAPVFGRNPPLWLKVPPPAEAFPSEHLGWRKQIRLTIELGQLPDKGAALCGMIEQLLEATRQEQLPVFAGPLACDTAAVPDLDLWLNGGPMLYTLRDPDKQSELVDTVQVLPLNAQRLKRLACLLVWKYNQEAEQLQVHLQAIAPVKRALGGGKAKEKPLFWWQFP